MADSEQNEAKVNPALGVDPATVIASASAAGLRGHVMFSTSGSSGEPKWVALSREALVLSAGAVNRAVDATSSDVWLRAIPEFHVGGYAIGVRAEQLGCGLVELAGAWDPDRFVDLAGGATLCSLVPTQLFDLVEAGLAAPPSLRVVLVGGSALPVPLRDSAEALGWPVRETYGMTEAGSSVAIANPAGDLQLLDIWAARIGEGDSLQISGGALFTTYLDHPATGEWFATGDRVALAGDTLRILGRCDAVVKVLGERVDLDALQAHLPQGFAIVALPDERAGARLLLVGERGEGDLVSARFNASVAGFERLSGWVRVDEIPRSPLGKIQRAALLDQISDTTSEA